MCPPTPSSVSTWPFAVCPKAVTTAPVEVLTSAMLATLVPSTEVNFPPR
jgi:hypothetical protein